MSAVSDDDIATVRQFLGRRDTLDRARSPRALARRLAEGLSAKVAGVPHDGGAERFLETLVEAKARRPTPDDCTNAARGYVPRATRMASAASRNAASLGGSAGDQNS